MLSGKYHMLTTFLRFHLQCLKILSSTQCQFRIFTVDGIRLRLWNNILSHICDLHPCGLWKIPHNLPEIHHVKLLVWKQPSPWVGQWGINNNIELRTSATGGVSTTTLTYWGTSATGKAFPQAARQNRRAWWSGRRSWKRDDDQKSFGVDLKPDGQLHGVGCCWANSGEEKAIAHTHQAWRGFHQLMCLDYILVLQ